MPAVTMFNGTTTHERKDMTDTATIEPEAEAPEAAPEAKASAKTTKAASDKATPKKSTRRPAAAKQAAKPERTMSDEHKQALAAGREQGRVIRAYLDALSIVNRPKKRGRKRTRESIESRLAAIDKSFATASPVSRLSMIQERIDLTAELEAMDASTLDIDIEELEKEFKEAIVPYSERKGISLAAWKELGVPTALLKEAGLKR